MTKLKGNVREFGSCTLGANGLKISSDMSSFSNKTIEVSTYEQSWVVPYGITALTTTSTKFGVTAKDIICRLLALSEKWWSLTSSAPSRRQELTNTLRPQTVLRS